MSEICHFVPVDSIQPELYTRLEALELWSLAGVQLPALVVKQLTTPCLLIQNLLFRNCDVLTDQLLTELWAVRLVSSSLTVFLLLFLLRIPFGSLFDFLSQLKRDRSTRSGMATDNQSN